MDRTFLEKIITTSMCVAVIGLLVLKYIPNLEERDLNKNKSVEACKHYYELTNSENEYPDITRFHVVANSDSEDDQALKLKVRDYVLERLEKGITEMLKEEQGKISDGEAITNEKLWNERSEITKKYIKKNMKNIENWALTCIYKNGFNYGVKVSLGVTTIPEKEYDEIYFPAGNYEALTIIIGEGKGENWWCVVFPPLCLIDSKNTEYKETFEGDEKSKIVIKSKVKEIMGKKEKSPPAPPCLQGGMPRSGRGDSPYK